MPARLPQSLTKTLAFLRQQPLALLPQLESTGWKFREISVRVPEATTLCKKFCSYF